jgi:hypothetical protein
MNPFHGSEELTVDITLGQRVGIHHVYLANTASCQSFNGGAAYASRAEYDHL